MAFRSGGPLQRHEVARALHEARSRTLLLVAPLDEEELRVQHDPLMSPIVWDLGHIAHFEEVWLLENVEGDGGGGEGLRGVYNPFENPRSTRDSLQLPDRREALEYMAGVRRAVLDRLDGLDPGGGGPLLRDGFVFRMVLQHEYQHNETILQTLQLKRGRPYPAPRAQAPPEPAAGSAPEPGTMVRFPGGVVEVGTDDRSEAYDNERPRHPVELEPFLVDAGPVTCGEYARFVDDGGYERPELWSEAGRRWLESDDGDRAPKHWERRDGTWWTRVMDVEREVDPRHPVCHVCYWEAEAYARWAGKRLPTEFEWEAAATWNPAEGRALRFPWGDEPASTLRANLDASVFDTTPVGAWPGSVSPVGCHDMIGNVWEWTSTDFHGYPGYETFPYPEYSEVFFGGEYKVLRGGSWATRAGAIRSTFRNWDFPIRRQIFAGFRCARDDR